MRFSDDDLFQGAKWRKYPLPMQIRIEQNVQPNKPVRLHIGGLIKKDFKNVREAQKYIADKVIPAFDAVRDGFRSVANGLATSYSSTDNYTEFKPGPGSPNPPGPPIAAVA